MKRKLQIIVLTLITAVCVFSFTQPKKVNTKTPKQVLNYFLYNGLMRERLLEDGKSWMVDSTLFKVKETPHYTYLVSPINYCGGSPVYLASDISAAMMIKDTINEEEVYNDLPVSFKRIYGRNLLKKAPADLSEFKDIFFDGKALEEAFNKTYIKPTESIDGFLMQKVYDISLKEFGRNCTKVLIDVISKKAKFIEQTNVYKLKASNKKFDGISFCENAAIQILGKDYEKKKITPKEADCIRKSSDRIVGMMMRRQIDGSLPAILTCIKTVLKDYDPTYYNQVKNKLVL